MSSGSDGKKNIYLDFGSLACGILGSLIGNALDNYGGDTQGFFALEGPWGKLLPPTQIFLDMNSDGKFNASNSGAR